MRKDYSYDGVTYDNVSVDGNCYFREHDHKYLLPAEPDFEFNSVTTLLHEYGEPFDTIAVSEMCSKKKTSKWYGMTPEDIRAAWVATADMGTRLHLYGEHLLNGTVPPEIPPSPKAQWVPEIIEHIYGMGYELAMTEILVYSRALKLAGQSDILLKKKNKDGEWEYMIYDWKFLTDPIKKKSYYNPIKRRFTNMNGPFKYLQDCNWIHYSIQLSIYQTLTGNAGKITEKVLVVANDDRWDLIPTYPMRVFWDENHELQAVYEVWNGKWYDSRTDSLYKRKPKDIIGL